MLPGILFSSVSCHALVGAACLLQAIGCVCLHTVVGGNRTSTLCIFAVPWLFTPGEEKPALHAVQQQLL